MSSYAFVQNQKLKHELSKIPKKNIRHFLKWYGFLIAAAQCDDFIKKCPLPRFE